MSNVVALAPSIGRVYPRAYIPLIEKALPAHMMFLACEDLRKKGWEMRTDVLKHLNTSAAAALAKQDPYTVQRCAKAIDEMAVLMLARASPDDPRDAVLVCAFWLMKVIEEGCFNDLTNTAVLAAMHIVEDAKEDPQWRYDEAWLGKTSLDMLLLANRNGLYAKQLDPVMA